MPARKKDAFVRGFLEGVSWRILDRHRAIVRKLIHGHAGIYALYKGTKLYYVGLATNLMNRVNQHLKDRHKGKWDRFSVYLTTNAEHIRPLETLVLRIIDPVGNRVKGRLKSADDLVKDLKRSIDEAQTDETASLLGGRFVRRRRRVKTRAAKGTRVLAGLVERRIPLVASYAGVKHRASLLRDGRIRYKGEVFDSPTSAAKAVHAGFRNGWHAWTFRNADGEWVRLRELKR